MKNKKLINWLCLSGVISIIFYLLHDIIGAMNYSGYNWMSQAVSDLTSTDAPSFVVASGFVTVYKILNCLCCALLCILIKNEDKKTLRLGVYLFSIMNFISAIGYALFPLSSAGYDGSLQSFIHVYILTALVVILSIISLVLIAIGSFKSKYKLLGISAIISLVLMFIGAVGSANVSKDIFGIVERFSTYSAVVFTGILGIFGFIKNTSEVKDV
jgi:multisubunit Na+/H+ antiporter MnhC subunit